jgi:hypothetical protein
MINTVYNILKVLNFPCTWQLRAPFGTKNTVISYHFFGESGEEYGDGDYTEETGSCQVDVFCKGDFSNTVEQIKSLMKQGSFLFVSGNEEEEQVDGIGTVYHKILIFNYLKSEVL